MANPYILAETDTGTETSDPIALETIDHGMIPSSSALCLPGHECISENDQRRVRAIAHAVLSDRGADPGDTVMRLDELLDLIAARFPEPRACHPDREIFIADAAFHRDVLWLLLDDDLQLVSLKSLQELEDKVVTVLRQRVARTNRPPASPVDWRAALERTFGAPRTDRESAALAEKETALATLLERRVSVLSGGADTGKTSVLQVFLNELAAIEGQQDVLLLAPTGKARVRLSTTTGRSAMTIHQFLMRNGWLRSGSFALKRAGEKDTKAASAAMVVIDECSMIPSDLFGTLVQALDMNTVKRLILVGDPNQLPLSARAVPSLTSSTGSAKSMTPAWHLSPFPCEPPPPEIARQAPPSP